MARDARRGRDEIVPLDQASACHARLVAALGPHGAALKRFPTAGHNDVGLLCGAEWAAEFGALLDRAAAFEVEWSQCNRGDGASLRAAAFEVA